MHANGRAGTSGAAVLTGLTVLSLAAGSAAMAERPRIMLTGYWPPSNEAIRPFSANPDQNPGGWVGENWEGLGYDVYAYFPEFSPPDCTSCGKGTGDFEVDYQDTSADWWPIVNDLQPIAIITMSRTNGFFSWEMEKNTYNFDSWTNDYVAPFDPTPNPPDDSVPADTLRESTLAMQDVIDAIDAADLGLNAFICEDNSAGGFLSGFMAYHGTWYQAIHQDVADEAWCVAAGHVHVGRGIEWDVAREAARITVRTIIDQVDAARLAACPGDVAGAALEVNAEDLLALLGAWGSDGPGAAIAEPLDVVDTADLVGLLAGWGSCPR